MASSNRAPRRAGSPSPGTSRRKPARSPRKRATAPSLETKPQPPRPFFDVEDCAISELRPALYDGRAVWLKCPGCFAADRLTAKLSLRLRRWVCFTCGASGGPVAGLVVADLVVAAEEAAKS